MLSGTGRRGNVVTSTVASDAGVIRSKLPQRLLMVLLILLLRGGMRAALDVWNALFCMHVVIDRRQVNMRKRLERGETKTDLTRGSETNLVP